MKKDRKLKLFPSQLREGDYWYVTDATRPGAYGYGHRYPMVVREDGPFDEAEGWFTRKAQVTVPVRGGIPVFNEDTVSMYKGERVEVYRPA